MFLLGTSVMLKGRESLYALAFGLQPMRLVEVQYVVSGAGRGGAGDVRIKLLPDLSERLMSFRK